MNYKINNKSETEAEVLIYEEIDAYWGMGAKSFISQLKSLKQKDVTVRINSAGGSVFDGIAIYNVIKDSDKNITVKIDGLAASIASVIAMAGKKVIMADNAMMMIHNPWNGIWGDAEDMRSMAELLDKIKETIITSYKNKTGLEESVISKMMDEETWMTAKEAKEFGFIDEIGSEIKIAARIDISQYNFKNKAKYQQTQGVNMEEILKALGAQTMDEALAKLKDLKEKVNQVETMQNKINEMDKERRGNIVNLAIANKKFLPSQKEFAVNLLEKDEELYNKWLQSNTVTPLDTTVSIQDGTSESLTDWQILMKDPVKAQQLFETNPEQYNAIKNKYFESLR